MGYVLKDGLYCCVSNGRAVFLDLAADRYFCLPEPLDYAMRSLMETKKGDRDLLAPLVTNGILRVQPAAESTWLPADIEPAGSSFEDKGSTAASLPLLWRAAWTHAISNIQIKGSSLSQIVSDLNKKFRSDKLVHPSDAQALKGLVAAFLASERLLSNQDQCLRRSVALIRYLAGQRLRAQLVIGVKMAPFGAHAWAQSGDVVLNDALDIVRAYTPILVV